MIDKVTAPAHPCSCFYQRLQIPERKIQVSAVPFLRRYFSVFKHSYPRIFCNFIAKYNPKYKINLGTFLLFFTQKRIYSRGKSSLQGLVFFQTALLPHHSCCSSRLFLSIIRVAKGSEWCKNNCFLRNFSSSLAFFFFPEVHFRVWIKVIFD